MVENMKVHVLYAGNAILLIGLFALNVRLYNIRRNMELKINVSKSRVVLLEK